MKILVIWGTTKEKVVFTEEAIIRASPIISLLHRNNEILKALHE